MPRKKQATPKTIGFQQGSMKEALLKHKLNPAEELVKAVLETDDSGNYVLSTQERVKILQECQSYCESKKRPSLTDENEREINISIINYSGIDISSSREEDKKIPELNFSEEPLDNGS